MYNCYTKVNKLTIKTIFIKKTVNKLTIKTTKYKKMINLLIKNTTKYKKMINSLSFFLRIKILCNIKAKIKFQQLFEFFNKKGQQ